MAKVRGRREGEKCRWCQNRVEHMHDEGHHDVPRFGALRRDNTPTPACLLYINALWNYNNCCRIYSGEGERRRGQSSPASQRNNGKQQMNWGEMNVKASL